MECEEVIGVDTALHEAVRYGDLGEVKVALRDGHDPNQIGLYQWSAVHEAANNGDYDILRALLRHGGNPNKQDLLKGCTAVHYAAQEGHLECLRLLVNAGGRFDLANSSGDTALDLAVNEECASLLRSQRDHDMLNSSGSFRSSGKALSDSFSSRRSLMREDSLLERSSHLTDDSYIDEISIASGSTDSGKPHSQGWGPDGVVGLRKDIVLGRIQLSFEYNSKTEIFKVRVWQVSDLLLPPADTSMISTIYVKGYLYPDKRKETKRKTEEVKADPPHYMLTKKTSAGQSQSAIFKPSTFKFSKPLEYKNVTKVMVLDKTLNIDVCVTQKYSWKSFPVASFSIPLKIAVRKLVKEKFPLNPRLSTNIPENMKIYSAKDLEVTRRSSGYGSIPNLRSPSMRSFNSHSSHAASDSGINLATIECELPKAPSIEITLTPEQLKEEEELQEALQQIKVMEEKEESAIVPVPDNKSKIYGASLDASVTSLDYDLDDHVHVLEDIKVQVPTQTTNVEDWDYSDDSDVESGKSGKNSRNGKSSSSGKGKGKKFSGLKKLTIMRNKSKSNSGSFSDKDRRRKVSESSMESGIRSDSPSWDNHVEPMTLGLVPMDFEYDEPRVRPPSSGSPSSSTGLAEIHQSFSPHNAVTITADVHTPAKQGKARIMLEDESPNSMSTSPPDFRSLSSRSSLQPVPVNSGYSSPKSSRHSRAIKSSQKGDTVNMKHFHVKPGLTKQERENTVYNIEDDNISEFEV